MDSNASPIRWENGQLFLLDQTLLPNETQWKVYTRGVAVAGAIQTMVVRGAPAIGIAAAYGMVLAFKQAVTRTQTWNDLLPQLEQQRDILRESRPTAVNLMWAVDQQWDLIHAAAAEGKSPEQALVALENRARDIHEEDLTANIRMGDLGARLLPAHASILTHCNAGGLATAGYGTALGVIRSAYKSGKCAQVFADETRPRLQGAKLTTYELVASGIPTTLICDNMAASLMKAGKIDAVIVGADRIAANGDVANKIGTYNVAVLAQYHQVPFYVAAPLSTFDLSLVNGDSIPIEERQPEEITVVNGERLAPEAVSVYNPAFDVTPAELVTAIITPEGIIKPPSSETVKACFEQAKAPKALPLG